MDLAEVYFAFHNLKENSVRFDRATFENCIKFRILSQIVFTVFATFAGVSACFMSIGLLINYEFFSAKVIQTFLYMNYLIFGPYLLAASLLGFSNFDDVVYNCDNGNAITKSLNFSIFMALCLCFLFSSIITVGFSFAGAFFKTINSIRFRNNGNYLIGKIFWKCVMYRNRPGIDQSNMESELQNFEVR